MRNFEIYERRNDIPICTFWRKNVREWDSWIYFTLMLITEKNYTWNNSKITFIYLIMTKIKINGIERWSALSLEFAYTIQLMMLKHKFQIITTDGRTAVKSIEGRLYKEQKFKIHEQKTYANEVTKQWTQSKWEIFCAL